MATLGFRDLTKVRRVIRWENYSNNLGAGQQAFESDTVPVGENWVITLISAHNSTTTVSTVDIFRGPAATNAIIDSGTGNARTNRLTWTGMLILRPGLNIRIVYSACLANDELSSLVMGWAYLVEGL